MSLLHLVLVALIQGITEFLPISSSGHLILLPALTGLDDQGLTIDVAAHVGTLFAVILYFRRDVGEAVRGLADLARGRRESYGARLALGLILATIPVGLAGLVLQVTGLEARLRGIAVIGWTMLLFGLLLGWADKHYPEGRTAADWTPRGALILGLWQALALIPGTSRSGITITGARMLGFDRREAARLSMLMSIPVIIASGTLLGIDVALANEPGALRGGAIVAGLSFVAALGALSLMMRLLRSVSYTPYVIYRIVFGAILLWIAYS